MNTLRRGAGPAVFVVAFIVLGLPDFGHGVAWPTMRSDFGRPLADLGTFLIVAAAGYLVVATNVGRMAKRWGVEGLVLRATLSSAAGLLLIAVAPVWPVVLTGSALCGLGAGGMDTGFNAAVALRQDSRLMGLLHAGYGLGAAVGPLVAGASLAIGGGWRPAYVVFGAASLLLVLPIVGKSMGDAPPQQTMGSPRGMLLPCLAFVVYVSLEVTIGQWAFTYLTGDRGLAEFTASSFVAVYWISLTSGRLWLGLSGHRVAVKGLLVRAVGGAAIGAAILWLGGPAAPCGARGRGPVAVCRLPAAHAADAGTGGCRASSSRGGVADGRLVLGSGGRTSGRRDRSRPRGHRGVRGYRARDGHGTRGRGAGAGNGGQQRRRGTRDVVSAASATDRRVRVLPRHRSTFPSWSQRSSARRAPVSLRCGRSWRRS